MSQLLDALNARTLRLDQLEGMLPELTINEIDQALVLLDLRTRSIEQELSAERLGTRAAPDQTWRVRASRALHLLRAMQSRLVRYRKICNQQANAPRPKPSMVEKQHTRLIRQQAHLLAEEILNKHLANAKIHVPSVDDLPVVIVAALYSVLSACVRDDVELEENEQAIKDAAKAWLRHESRAVAIERVLSSFDPSCRKLLGADLAA